MAKTNRRRLSRAVRLLDEILQEEGRRVEKSNQGSSRELLMGLHRLRELLALELKGSGPDWTGLVVPLLREAAKLVLGELINNYRYIFRRLVTRQQAGIDRGTWVGDQILPATSGG
jgi:hypothetical protein